VRMGGGVKIDWRSGELHVQVECPSLALANTATRASRDLENLEQPQRLPISTGIHGERFSMV